MVVVKVNRVMKSDIRQSPQDVISTNECWLNVGPVLVSVGPISTQNVVVKGVCVCGGAGRKDS